MSGSDSVNSSDEQIAATTPDVRDEWPGHTQGELEAYREGFADALAWALRHEPEEIEAVLNADT